MIANRTESTEKRLKRQLNNCELWNHGLALLTRLCDAELSARFAASSKASCTGGAIAWFKDQVEHGRPTQTNVRIVAYDYWTGFECHRVLRKGYRFTSITLFKCTEKWRQIYSNQPIQLLFTDLSFTSEPMCLSQSSRAFHEYLQNLGYVTTMHWPPSYTRFLFSLWRPIDVQTWHCYCQTIKNVWTGTDFLIYRRELQNVLSPSHGGKLGADTLFTWLTMFHLIFWNCFSWAIVVHWQYSNLCKSNYELLM